MTRYQRRKLEQRIKAVIGVVIISLTAVIVPRMFKRLGKVEAEALETPVATVSSMDDLYAEIEKQIGQGTVVKNYESYLTDEVREALDDYLSTSPEHTIQDKTGDGITATAVNLRKGPSTDYDIIKLIPDETRLEIIGICDNNWVLVRANGGIGFMSGDYVRELTPEFIASQRIAVPDVQLTAVQATTGINVRSVPSADSEDTIIGGLREGDRVTAYEKLDNGWYRVRYNDRMAYVCGDYVKPLYGTQLDQYPIIRTKEGARLTSDPYTVGDYSLPADELLFVTGENLDYYYTSYNGHTGYIKKTQCNALTNTFILVDISDQELSIYQNGVRIFSTAVVTGRDGRETDLGLFTVYEKERNATLKGEDYCVQVSYAVKYNGAEYVHDANWRSSFGGEQYHTSGSHGCVNTPADVMASIYDTVSVGDNVYVRQ